MTIRLLHQFRYILSAFLAALLLAGCGGGSSPATSAAATPLAAEGDDGIDVAALGVATTTLAKALGASNDNSGWIACASENGTCNFDGFRTVRYGAGNRTVDKFFDSAASCGNGTFGDPVVGTVKTCSYSDVSWLPCASENGRCAFTGTHDVRYGTAENFTIKSGLVDGVACDNATFGDPKFGVVKSCWYAVTASSRAAAPPADPCQIVPALPTLPARYKLVTAFCRGGKCVRPDDGVDYTDQIDDALNASEGSFLVFPPGRYLISRSLRVKRPGVTLWGPGATIHATNPDDQSIIVEANNVSIYSFTLTAVTDQRRSRAENTRIAIYGPAGVNPVVTNTVIQNNQIVPAGAPGTSLANSASGAGIFVHAADGFLIAGNTVARSLADGIHMTGGARNGRVINNTVRETGDDMIAVVSYAYPDPNANTAATIIPNFATNVGIYQDRNILITSNTLSGQYWGRGIAVVGGHDITVRGNTLNNIPYAAGILVARETSSGSYGVDNVLVEGNSINDVQTMNPPYDVGNKFASNNRTGHGAIEVNSSVFLDELASPVLSAGMAITRVTIRNNVITSSATPGVRMGVGSGSYWTMGTRNATGNAPMSNFGFEGNAMKNIANSQPIQIVGNEGVASCTANTLADAGINAPRCASAKQSAAATGASLSCVQQAVTTQAFNSSAVTQRQ